MSDVTQPRRVPLQPLLLAVGFAILIGISAATAWLVDRAADDAESVQRTLMTQDRLATLQLIIRRAESGQRGYLLTGRDTYRNDFTEALPRIDPVLNELKELLDDTPAHRAQAEKIEATLRAKMAELGRGVDLVQQGNREGALALVLTDEGRTIMENLRTLVIEGIADQARLLTERTARTQQNNTLLLILTVLGAVVVAGIGALSVYLVQRTARQRERARQELALTNENLEQIVQHRTADLTEANEEIQRFAYIVSHDLRSPLVNIMGFTSELEAFRQQIFERLAALEKQVGESQKQAEANPAAPDAETLSKDFDEAIGFIKTSITKMDRLINAVLRLSREGRREFRPETIDMKAMLEAIQSSSKHQADSQGATVTIAPLPPVRSDRLALEQVFSNLVDNALKYLRRDEPGVIHVEGRETPSHVIYEVRDNGRGIDPADHQRIFELFRRSGAQDRPGEGIGLAHVRALVRRLGGTLRVESELGKGSTFIVSLPRHFSVEQNRSAA